MGDGTEILSPFHCDYGYQIEVGSRTYINFGAVILDSAPITLCDDVWLASGVVVCPGVTIGAGTTVGAGSVVTRDLPARYLCLGNPCPPVREV